MTRPVCRLDVHFPRPKFRALRAICRGRHEAREGAKVRHFSPINEHKATSKSTDEQGPSQIISEKAYSLMIVFKRVQGGDQGVGSGVNPALRLHPCRRSKLVPGSSRKVKQRFLGMQLAIPQGGQLQDLRQDGGARLSGATNA